MKVSTKMGLMATIIGMTAAIFGRKQQLKTYTAGLDYRTRKTAGKYMFGGFRHFNDQAIFIPRRTMFKGYMRDNRNWGKKR